MEGAAKGLPRAEFIEDVEGYMKAREGSQSAEDVVKELDALHTSYTTVSKALNAKKRRLLNQVPELKSTLAILGHVMEQKDADESISTDFLLADSLYAKATIQPTDTVCLWLGANVMLEYGTPEAKELLSGNLSMAETNLVVIQEELDTLKDALTTTEVNMARVYNYGVQRRRELGLPPPGKQ